MLKITLRRIIQSGYLIFKRNGWLSTATIMVMALVLFVLGNLMFLGALANTMLTAFESKIDISVYFTADAPEAAILGVQKELQSLPEVAEVTYISRDSALTQFREKHKSNALIADALTELGENPLEASVNIRAKDPSRYASISDFLVKKNYSVVDRVNYFENQAVIDKLGAIVTTVRGSGAFLAVFLALVAILVAFNTIRIAIYTMREEIGIMRLVGASSWFIRGPYLISGVIYGAIAALATTLVFFPLTWLVSPKLTTLVPSFDLFNYFLINFVEFSAVMFFSGIALGASSSFIAVRRYLKI